MLKLVGIDIDAMDSIGYQMMNVFLLTLACTDT